LTKRLHKLKDADEMFNQISVAHDMTPEERNKVRELVQEAKTKNSQDKEGYVYKVRGGPQNLKIVRLKRDL